VDIAKKHKPHSAIVADNLNLPHPDSYFDFAISIAVVHHLSSRERRVQAISAVLQTLKSPSFNPEGVGGKALIYVWALEQKNSRRGWNAGDEQDVMVPWVMKASGDVNERTKTFHRYYHLYSANELEQDIATAGGRVLDSGYEKDNWWAIAGRERPWNLTHQIISSLKHSSAFCASRIQFSRSFSIYDKTRAGRQRGDKKG
jgi:tRNA (uracil-5-)-methyltransferase TRM9